MKRFKQNFAVTAIKEGNTNYAETEMLLWLIIWTMAEQQAFLAECYIEGKENKKEIYSVYEKCKITFLQVKEILCLSWSLFINLSDKKYFRYLKKKRRWNNQNEEFHIAILPGLLV